MMRYEYSAIENAHPRFSLEIEAFGPSIEVTRDLLSPLLGLALTQG